MSSQLHVGHRSFSRFVRSVRGLRPERFVLIGSRARGNPLRESDFDIVLVASGFRGISAHERDRSVRSLWPLDVGLDLLCLTPEEYRREEERGISWVVAEMRRGVDLLEHDEPPSEGSTEMREETRQWWALAQSDMRQAREILERGRDLHIVVFHAEQAAEKALKALWVEVERADPPKTHEIESLASKLGAPDEILTASRNLAPEFVMTRYPSPSLGNPLERYTLRAAQERVAEARRVLDWVEPRLPSHDA